MINRPNERRWFRLRKTGLGVVVMLLTLGAVAQGGVVLAAASDLHRKADLLERDMAGHELIMIARMDADAAEAASSRQKKVSKTDSDAARYSQEPEAREDELPEETLFPDPLEPMNRFFFTFNDYAYFWFFKPIAEGYSAVMPDVMRISIRNFFTNLGMPIRLFSSLLQGKLKSAGIVLVRFMVNSTAGFLGFQDVAKEALDYPLQEEDFGQAFAFYGIGPGCYLSLPFLGASSLRDTAGWVAGLFVNPLDYIVDEWVPNLSARAFNIVNNTSLRVGEYEALKEASLDPYVAMRDAYFQYRQNQIEK